MPDDPTATGVSTASTTTVNPAQQSVTIPTAPFVSPPLTTTTGNYTVSTSSSPMNHDEIQKYEERIRALMSEKDRHRSEYERAVADRQSTQQQLDELTRKQAEIMNGAAKSVEAALNAQKATEAQMQAQAAENTKLRLLMQHPDLAPYADLIPAHADEGQMRGQIEKFLAARKADLERAMAAQTPPTPAAPQTPPSGEPKAGEPNLWNLYPKGTIPPTAPARPQPGASAHSVDSLQADLKSKMEQFLSNRDLDGMQRYLQEQAKLAETITRAQLGGQ